MAGHQFDPEEIKALLATGHVGPLEGFRSKEGRPFSAALKLGIDGKPEFDFPEAKEAPDFTGQEPRCTPVQSAKKARSLRPRPLTCATARWAKRKTAPSA